ncbi:MAG: hypothetical protein ACI85K_002549, partial [Hyphomicrobiaceae bacterium]
CTANDAGMFHLSRLIGVASHLQGMPCSEPTFGSARF